MTDPTRAAELTAAVERLRRGFVYGSCPDGWGECCDARLVAEHYLATMAADDDEPIDEAWLLSVGCKPVADHRSAHMYMIRDVAGRLHVNARYGDVWRGKERLTFIKTRRQLRRLCQCLDIALTPIGQEDGK